MKLDVFRIGASLATATLTVLAATACGADKPAYVYPKTVRHSELVGRWDGDRKCGSPLPVIRLRDDYTFSAKDYPIEWDGPVPDAQVTRISAGGEWHATTKDPGLPPYLVLNFENRNDSQFLTFTVDHGKLRMDGSVQADGGDPYIYPCHYVRASVDPESGR